MKLVKRKMRDLKVGDVYFIGLHEPRMVVEKYRTFLHKHLEMKVMYICSTYYGPEEIKVKVRNEALDYEVWTVC